ncbi:MAG: glycoside hydrolase [Gammaproteobacteria bacterium]
MTPQDKCVAEARKYIGAKWRHRGRKPWALDCIGLIVASVHAGGAPVEDRTDYGLEPWKDGLQADLERQFGEPVADWLPGDIALMRRDGGTEPAHVGVLADSPYGGLALIHSYRMVGVTEHRIDEHWRELIVAVYRPRWPV